MKITKLMLFFVISALFISCNRNAENEEGQIIPEQINAFTISMDVLDTLSYLDENNYDWMTEYGWLVLDGRWLEDSTVQPIDRVYGNARVIFRKLKIPPNSVFYQERLRRVRFTLMYQTEERSKFNILENSDNISVFNVEFMDNYSRIRRFIDGTPWGFSNRVGEQENPDFPLVGIWGNLPFLTEYRIVEPLDSVYTMEIIEANINWGIPDSVVRVGIYLLRRVGETTFETVTAFPDGHLRLEIQNDRHILLRPLFELPEDEEGIVGLLQMHRDHVKLSEMPDPSFNPFDFDW
jgi:hypothetical protein